MIFVMNTEENEVYSETQIYIKTTPKKGTKTWTKSVTHKNCHLEVCLCTACTHIKLQLVAFIQKGGHSKMTISGIYTKCHPKKMVILDNAKKLSGQNCQKKYRVTHINDLKSVKRSTLQSDAPTKRKVTIINIESIIIGH
jgi:hypothetical protein